MSLELGFPRFETGDLTSLGDEKLWFNPFVQADGAAFTPSIDT